MSKENTDEKPIYSFSTETKDAPVEGPEGECIEGGRASEKQEAQEKSAHPYFGRASARDAARDRRAEDVLERIRAKLELELTYVQQIMRSLEAIDLDGMKRKAKECRAVAQQVTRRVRQIEGRHRHLAHRYDKITKRIIAHMRPLRHGKLLLATNHDMEALEKYVRRKRKRVAQWRWRHAMRNRLKNG